MNTERLLQLYDRVSEAPDAIPRLRKFILDLAVRGKLVEQDLDDESATELLARISRAKALRVRNGQVKSRPDLPDVLNEGQYDLPSSWNWVRFGNIVDFSAGRTPSRNDTSLWNTGDYAWVSIADMVNGEAVVATKETVSSKARSQVFKCEPEPPGTIIMSFKLTIGKTSRLQIPAFHNEAIISIRPHLDELDPFLFRVLPDLARGGETKGAIKGATLNRESISNILVPLPPLAEQHRIVAKIDELMALCDRLEAEREERETTRDRLTTASLSRLTAPEVDEKQFKAHADFAIKVLPELTTRPDQINTLRQTILDLAVRGKLAEQDPNDEPVGIRQISLDATPPFDVPMSWRWLNFASVAEFENGDRSKKYPKKAEYVSAGVPWINTGHIQPDGSLCKITMHYITEAKFESLGGGKIRPGDLVYCLRGATFGKTAFVEPFKKGAIASSLMIIRPNDELDRRYAYLFLMSPLGREQLRRFDNGTAQPNLSSANVKRYLIPLPPPLEQHRIVAKVRELMTVCDQLEKILSSGCQIRECLGNALLITGTGAIPRKAA